jgi:IS4 transposase
VRDFRAYEKLIAVDLVKSDIVLHLKYERADGNREIEDVYFVEGGYVSLGDLVLASYILDDETWKWILEEATNYLVLARETDVVLNEYLLPAIKLVS